MARDSANYPFENEPTSFIKMENKRDESLKNFATTDSSDSTIFLDSGVKESKNELLKTRLQTLINSLGMKEAQFYHKLGISKQYWYFISWGIWECPHELKIRIAKALNSDTSIIWKEVKNG